MREKKVLRADDYSDEFLEKASKAVSKMKIAMLQDTYKDLLAHEEWYAAAKIGALIIECYEDVCDGDLFLSPHDDGEKA